MSELETWTTLKVLNWTKDYLLSKGVINARLEAEWMLCSVTGLNRMELYLQFDKPLIDSELAAYRALVTRRARREPLQHILGTEEFCGLEFKVTADVLIPRHDSELLVSQALIRYPDALSVLDIGTGSGCIAISLQKSFPNATVTATDISEAAVAVARINADKHHSSIQFLAGSLFIPVFDRSFDLIVSNPPYIPTDVINTLEEEVRNYDPRLALDGGIDGLDLYRQLIPEAIEHLNPGGWIILEIGINQAADIVDIFRITDNYCEPNIVFDSGGIERVLAVQLKEKL